MRTIVLFIIGLSAGIYSTGVNAQGCSDAGFCTIGDLAPRPADTSRLKKHYISLQLPVGIGDDEVWVVTPAIEYGIQLSGHWALQAKLTANYASGNLGSAAGAGDVFLSGTYLFRPGAAWKLSATLGTKLPLNQGNLKENGLSLPMQYQSSLGTVDLIAGLALQSARWQFAAGWQQPLSGINRNNFLPVYWSHSSAGKYPPSNDFNRKGDVLLRAAYSLSQQKRWHLQAGLLGVYHLASDTYIDANVSNRPIPIEGSRGLTLNATATFSYPVSSRVRVGITGGIPLAVREVRPDGLTRSFVFSPDIRFNF